LQEALPLRFLSLQTAADLWQLGTYLTACVDEQRGLMMSAAELKSLTVLPDEEVGLVQKGAMSEDTGVALGYQARHC